MPSLTFPTRPPSQGRVTAGLPDRADPCRCTDPWPDGDHCLRCGHYSESTISHTWRMRALVIANRKPARAAA